MGFVEDFIPNDEKVEKILKYTGARGGTFELKSLQIGEFVDLRIKSIIRVVNEKTTRYNEKGAMSAVIEILGISGKPYHGLDMNMWLTENIRSNMAAELRKRKIPISEDAILRSIWRVFPVYNRNAPQNRWITDPLTNKKTPPIIYSAVLSTDQYADASKQAENGTSAENLFGGLI